MVLPLALAAAIVLAACGSSTSSVRPMASAAAGTPTANTLSPGAAATQGSNPTAIIGQTPSPTPTAKPSPTPTAKPNPTPIAKPNPTPIAKLPTPTAKPNPTPIAKLPTPTAKPNPTAPPVGRLPNFSHVYVIIFENKEYSSIVGSSSAPYINSLISQYGLATNFYAERHPSEPNYIALTSGGTQGIADDGVYNLGVNNLFDQITASGRTWKAVQQGNPGNCFTGSSSAAVVDGVGKSGAYVRKHNPAISYTSISGNAAKCANITNLASFDPAAANFQFITPNMINDMHDGTVADGDNFLKAFLPKITTSAAFSNSLILVTFDEGTSGTNGGGHIVTIAITPQMTAGFQATAAYTHYSMLRTIEQAWGLPDLGSAGSASWMQFPY
jgi:acid phosphatase